LAGVTSIKQNTHVKPDILSEQGYTKSTGVFLIKLSLFLAVLNTLQKVTQVEIGILMLGHKSGNHTVAGSIVGKQLGFQFLWFITFNFVIFSSFNICTKCAEKLVSPQLDLFSF